MACESQEDKSARFLYSGVSSKGPTVQTHLANQMQGFVSNPELFNLTTGIEMLGFPPKNFQQREGNSDMLWKGFLGKSCNQGSSSSKTINEQRSDLYHPQYSKQDFSTGFSETTNENLLDASDSGWQDNNRLLVDDSSLRCVFPCEGNERPSQGLSLSLSSNKPTGVEVKSFELRETSRLHGHDHHHHRQEEEDDGGDIRFTTSSTSSDGFLGRSENIRQQQQHKLLQDRIFGRASGLYETQFQLKNSMYLAPAQELLKEFCNLGAKQPDTQKHKTGSANQLDDENGCGSSSRKQPSYVVDLLELQKRKAKLLSMLDEVDRRYRHYCDQMKAVVLSFEAVAGSGAATAYTALASKAMSRHFRSLRDGIVSQIQATKKALGEKDPVALGTTRGETPRLRLLDQTLRQQKAFQQMTMLESHPWRPQRGLPERSVSVLRAWLFEHFLHPYPSDVDKHILARQAGLSRSQVSNWFINARVRLWKPMVEEMYLEETNDKDNMASSDGITGIDENISRSNQNCSPAPLNPQTRSGDQKPTADQIIRMDSECLSSIINKTERHGIKKRGSHESDQQQPREEQHHHHSNFGRVREAFGVVDLDFSSYNHQTPSNISYGHHGIHQNFGSSVSLTLGLQQHRTSGVSLAFSPPSQHSIFFPRDQIEDCQPVQYSMLDGEAENLPYRDLLGAQLLHDFAG